MNNKKSFSVVNFILFLLILAALGFMGYVIAQKDTMADKNTVGETVEEKTVLKTTGRRNTASAGNNSIRLNLNSVDDSANLYRENRYFYNQLNSSAKSMYNSIEKNIDSLKNGTKSIDLDVNTETAGESFQSAWDAFELDHPEIFYVETTSLNLLTKTTTNLLGRTKYEYTIQPKDGGYTYLTESFNSEYDVNQAIDRIESIANNVANNANLKDSRYEKIKYVHDYIVDNAHYDQQGLAENSTIYGLMINNAAICEGYAKSFKYMMDKLNIPCVVIYGEGISSDGSSEYHAWDEVQMEDGNWYAIDTSWDDPIIIGNGKLTDEYKYKYFLVGSDNFSSSHIPESDVSGTGQNFVYPELSIKNY